MLSVECTIIALPLLQWKIWTYWQLQLKHYTCPIAQQTGCSSHSSLAAHSKLSFAYSAQRSQLNRAKCSLFNRVQMQRLFSKSFLRIWNTFSFHKHHQCTAVQWVKRCGGKSALCPIMISGLRSEISANLDCDTWIRVSSNFFNSNRILDKDCSI